jgi:prevent-host-death family protein
MKFVSVRDLRLKPGDIWKLAKQEKDLIITANGRPVAILTGVNEETFSEELDAIQRARALKALDSIHQASVIKGTNLITDKEIKSEINAVRKEKEF